MQRFRLTMEFKAGTSKKDVEAIADAAQDVLDVAWMQNIGRVDTGYRTDDGQPIRVGDVLLDTVMKRRVGVVRACLPGDSCTGYEAVRRGRRATIHFNLNNGNLKGLVIKK